MNQIISKKFCSIVGRLLGSIGSGMVRNIITVAAHRADIDLLEVAYNDIGVLNYKNYQESGERYLLDIVVKKIDLNHPPVIFDVGANSGGYARLLKELFPDATIHAFEPNTHAFAELKGTLGDSVTCYQFGFGDCSGNSPLYSYVDCLGSSHATGYCGMFKDFYRTADVSEINCKMTTIDEFCQENEIDRIDFIKIDTEGAEHKIMTGARKMIVQKRITAIQFEFGECNVFSRVFLRDFYGLLEGYNFYRLNRSSLVPLGAYYIGNEIFRYQNIFAILKEKDVFNTLKQVI